LSIFDVHSIPVGSHDRTLYLSSPSQPLTNTLPVTGISLPLAYRKKQLKQLYNLVTENEALLFAALRKDLRKHEVESIGGEIAPVAEECLWFLEVCALLCLRKYTMKKKKLTTNTDMVCACSLSFLKNTSYSTSTLMSSPRTKK
jgi:hypothetical protein